jgi:hypothetical protein
MREGKKNKKPGMQRVYSRRHIVFTLRRGLCALPLSQTQ